MQSLLVVFSETNQFLRKISLQGQPCLWWGDRRHWGREPRPRKEAITKGQAKTRMEEKGVRVRRCLGNKLRKTQGPNACIPELLFNYTCILFCHPHTFMCISWAHSSVVVCFHVCLTVSQVLLVDWILFLGIFLSSRPQHGAWHMIVTLRTLNQTN